MKRVALGLALLAGAQPVLAQTAISTDATGGYTGFPISLTSPSGGFRRSLLQGMAIVDPNNGNALGTPGNPISVMSGTAGGGVGNTTDATGSGALALGTLNSAYVIPLSGGRAVVGLRISGLTGSGAVITAERSNDGGFTWTNANTTESSATSSLSATIANDGQARVGAAGATNLRLRVSTAGTGTASIAYDASAATGPVFLISLLPSTTTPGTGVIGGVNNQMVAGNTISVGTGAADAGTQRVALNAESANTLTAINANSASYTIGVSATTATGTFYTTGTTAAPTRAVKLDAASGVTCSATLTSPNGNTTVQTQVGPNKYDPFIAASWSGLTTGCTITGLY